MTGSTSDLHYVAMSPDGTEVSGRLSTSDRREAITELGRLGLFAVSVDTRSTKASLLDRELRLARPSLSRKLLARFARELANALGAGASTGDALVLIAPSATQPKAYRHFYTIVLASVRSGLRLSAAVRLTGLRLPPEFAPLIEAGESTASLPLVLRQLSDDYEKQGELGQTIVGAVAYPLLLLLVAIGALAIIALNVAPTLDDLFIAAGKPTPWVISLLTALGGAVVQQAWILPLLVVLLLALAVLAERLGVRVAIGRRLERWTTFRNSIAWRRAATFSSTMKLAIANHVSLETALGVAMTAAGLPSHRGRLAIDAMRAGQSLSSALLAARVLPDATLPMVTVGERTGMLADAFATIASEAQRRSKLRHTLISALLAPLLILIVGTFSGTIIYAVFSALLDLNQIAS
jgi:type II secretory pathway component PulF